MEAADARVQDPDPSGAAFDLGCSPQPQQPVKVQRRSETSVRRAKELTSSLICSANHRGLLFKKKEKKKPSVVSKEVFPERDPSLLREGG